MACGYPNNALQGMQHHAVIAYEFANVFKCRGRPPDWFIKAFKVTKPSNCAVPFGAQPARELISTCPFIDMKVGELAFKSRGVCSASVGLGARHASC